MQSLTNILSGRWRTIVGLVVVLAVGGIAAQDRFFVFLASSAAIAFMLTVSFNLIYGYAGIFSLAHVAVYGIGAYVGVLLQMELGVPFLLAVPVAVVVTSLVGVVLWYPTRHLHELFFAIATLGFAVTVEELMLKWTSITGGGQGLLGIPPADVFGVEAPSGLGFYWIVAVGALLAWEVSHRSMESAMGRQFVALRDAPLALAATGRSPGGVRFWAFAISNGLAGLAGVLFAHHNLFISSGSFGLGRLIELILAVLIGGAGTQLGPLLGVGVLVGISEAGAAFVDYRELVFGAAIIVMLGYGRGGVAGILRSVYVRLRPESEASPTLADMADQPEISSLSFGASIESIKTIRVEDVHVHFGGVTALSAVDLELSSGAVVGLLGPNGAGKTTLVNAITGHVSPSEGRVLLDGMRLDGQRPEDVARAGVVRTFQTPQLLGDETLTRNVTLGFDAHSEASAMARIWNTSKARHESAENARKAVRLLDRLGLSEVAGRDVGSQPYDVQRLTELGRCLATEPDFLLLDEPGAGLNESERDTVTSVVRELAQAGLGILLIDHNVSFVAELADHLVVLDSGRVIATGSPKDVLSQSQVVDAFLGGEVHVD